MAHIGRDEVVRRRLISGVSRKKSKEIIDEIVTRRSRWVYFCPGSTQEMAVQRSGRGIVDDHAGGVGRTGQRHRHNAMGVFLCFCQLLGELTCRDSGWLSWARFALPVASGFPVWPDSGYEGWFLVEDAVFEHAVDYVAASAREADDSGVVVLALFAFALVVGDGQRVFGGRDEQGLPQRVPEAFVAPSGGSLALDAGAGLAGGRSDAGVGGQVGRAFEVGDVADDVPAYQDFMKQIVDQGIYIQWYDSATYPGGGVGYQDMFNGSNSPYVQDTDKGKISDSIFLNYWFSGNMLKDSAAHAESFGIDPKYAVFAGIESGQKKFDSIGSNAGYMNVNLDDTGKPYVSLAALGTDFVSRELGDDKKIYPKYQNQVFDRERRLWTGSSTGEKGTTDIADNYIDDGTSNDGWKGFASQIAECSVVGGSMFSTSFNTGHGLEWRDGGERTSDQQWGNINLQDILPTWQWWIDADSDPLQADFDYGKDYEAVPRFKYTKVGGYEGGDSLVLSGKLSNDNTIRLYKTDLDVAAGSKIDLTYNKLNSDDSKLQLGLILADDPETVVPVDVTDGSAGNGWKTASVDLSQYAGKKIATLGLIVKWNLADYSTIKNYLLYLDNTFLGGRYDDTLYVKHLPAKTGTLKLYAVGADGSRSLATEAPLNEAAAVSDVKVEPGKDGNVKVSWTNPQVSGEKTVTVKSDTGSWRYAAKPYSQTVKVAADKSKVTIANAPVDSSRYVVNVDNAGGTTATATGAFADAAIEPYPACSVIWNGDNVTLARPETQDWRYLYMTEKWIGENGKQQQENQLGASYTYSQNTPPITGIIRGRTTPASYTRSIPRQS